MKISKIIVGITLSVLVLSCNKETSKSENDVEVHVVDEHNQDMTANDKLAVEVVNEKDPICGMSTADHLKDTTEYKGKTYGFCNTMCKDKFLENPDQYVNE